MRSLYPDTIYTCGSCGLTHPKVECGGIYHCPNPLCFGCGGHTHRVPHTDEDGTDVLAWVLAALAVEVSAELVEVRDACLLKLVAKYGLDHPIIEAHLARMAA